MTETRETKTKSFRVYLVLGVIQVWVAVVLATMAVVSADWVSPWATAATVFFAVAAVVGLLSGFGLTVAAIVKARNVRA